MLNAEDGAEGFGHNAIMLVDKNGNSAFFSYYSNNSGAFLDNLTEKSNGEMRFKTLNADETKAFFENKSINNAISSDGTLENETYTRYLSYDVSSIQGTNMLKSAIDFFVKPGMYGLLESSSHDYDDVWQCDAVTREILEKGGIRPWGIAIPNWSFWLNEKSKEVNEKIDNGTKKIIEWID